VAGLRCAIRSGGTRFIGGVFKVSVVSLGFVEPFEVSYLNPVLNTACYLKIFFLGALVIKVSRQSMCLSWEV
jgi:hypothetical protein